MVTVFELDSTTSKHRVPLGHHIQPSSTLKECFTTQTSEALPPLKTVPYFPYAHSRNDVMEKVAFLSKEREALLKRLQELSLGTKTLILEPVQPEAPTSDTLDKSDDSILPKDEDPEKKTVTLLGSLKPVEEPHDVSLLLRDSDAFIPAQGLRRFVAGKTKQILATLEDEVFIPESSTTVPEGIPEDPPLPDPTQVFWTDKGPSAYSHPPSQTMTTTAAPTDDAQLHNTVTHVSNSNQPGKLMQLGTVSQALSDVALERGWFECTPITHDQGYNIYTPSGRRQAWAHLRSTQLDLPWQPTQGTLLKRSIYESQIKNPLEGVSSPQTSIPRATVLQPVPSFIEASFTWNSVDDNLFLRIFTDANLCMIDAQKQTVHAALKGQDRTRRSEWAFKQPSFRNRFTSETDAKLFATSKTNALCTRDAELSAANPWVLLDAPSVKSSLSSTTTVTAQSGQPKFCTTLQASYPFANRSVGSMSDPNSLIAKLTSAFTAETGVGG